MTNDPICNHCREPITSDFDVEATELALVGNAALHITILTCHRCLRKRTQSPVQDWRPGKTEKNDV